MMVKIFFSMEKNVKRNISSDYIQVTKGVLVGQGNFHNGKRCNMNT